MFDKWNWYLLEVFIMSIVIYVEFLVEECINYEIVCGKFSCCWVFIICICIVLKYRMICWVGVEVVVIDIFLWENFI